MCSYCVLLILVIAYIKIRRDTGYKQKHSDSTCH